MLIFIEFIFSKHKSNLLNLASASALGTSRSTRVLGIRPPAETTRILAAKALGHGSVAPPRQRCFRHNVQRPRALRHLTRHLLAVVAPERVRGREQHVDAVLALEHHARTIVVQLGVMILQRSESIAFAILRPQALADLHPVVVTHVIFHPFHSTCFRFYSFIY